jgi:hypothetical protein
MWTRWLATLACAATIAGCGARSGLGVPDGAPSRADAGVDAWAMDAPAVDAFREDAFRVIDVGTDAPVDAPPPPPICTDATVQFIYVVSQENGLFSYHPPSGTLRRIGTIACPVDPTVTPPPTPWSMSVDRAGTAYVIFNDGHLFRVHTSDARCEATSYTPNQNGWLTFGMGFTADRTDPGERLFVTEADFMGPSQGLAWIDTTTLRLNVVGPYSTTLGRSELTGSRDGRLFAFSLDPAAGSNVSEVDPTSARVLSSTHLDIGTPESAWAGAFYGGDFYLFTTPPGARSGTTVTRYRPADGSTTVVSSLTETIVGAGVSTCAPL